MALRKNFVFLTGLERTRLASAFNKVESSGFLGELADEHDANFLNGIHWGSAFLPWHRHFLLRLETELQNVEHPDVMIPYWDWTRPDSRSLDAEPWKSFFGGRNNTGGEFDHWSYTRGPLPSASDPNPNRHLPVLVADGTPARSIVGELDTATFTAFRSLEAFGSHPPGHVWTGGTMAGGRSPADPLFWLHHCNIDRLWAIWQRNNPGAEQYNTDPAPGDSVSQAMVALHSPMVGGATPASMLDHTAHGYTYPTDVRLEAAWEGQGLGRLVTADATATDFYIRDSAADTGESPSPVPHWQSPDIWVRNAPPGPGENPEDGHQAPIVSQPNHIYVRVHNRGAPQTGPVTVEAYRCTPGTGMLWPDHFQSLGSLPLASVVGTGGDTHVGPFVWTPTVEGHECLLAIVRTEAEDPGSLESVHGVTVPAGTAASIDHSLLVRFDNNVGQRNVAPVLASPGSSTRMGLVINGLDRTSEHSLVIDAVGLPADTAIATRLANGVIDSGATDMEVGERNSRFTTLELGGGAVGNISDVVIRAKQSFTLTITVDFSFEATHLQQYPLRIQQVHEGTVIGAYTIELTAVKDLEDFFFGNPRSMELHVSSCQFWDQINKARLRTYERIADGQARGYNGCRFCLTEVDTG